MMKTQEEYREVLKKTISELNDSSNECLMAIAELSALDQADRISALEKSLSDLIRLGDEPRYADNATYAEWEKAVEDAVQLLNKTS